MEKPEKPEFISIYEAPRPEQRADAIDPAAIDSKMAGKLARNAARLVDQHPEDAVRVLRGWLQSG